MRLFGRSESAPKGYHGGTHRTRSPQQTLSTYLPLMARCGITRLANVTGLDFIGIPVYAAIRPLSRSLSVAQGKGADPDAAKASALMESLEQWHAEHPVLPLRHESPQGLASAERVLDTRAIPRLGRSQARDQKQAWVGGWDLLAEAPIWVPYDLVHLSFIEPPVLPRLYVPDSNGLASGNCLLEATTHALCELIERDAMTLWFVDPRLDSDLDTLIDLAHVDEHNRALIDRIQAAELHLAAFDMTSDLGIPCYSAVVFDRPGSLRAMGYFWGFGCHLDPQVALSRAVTEAVQCRLTEITGAREDILPDDFLRNRDDAELAAMAARVQGARPQRRLADRPPRYTPTFEGDLAVLCRALADAGITQAAVVDLSQPDIGLPVVKVVVPELEGAFVSPSQPLRPRGQRLMDRWQAELAEQQVQP